MKIHKKTLKIEIDYHDHGELLRVLDRIKSEIHRTDKKSANVGSAKFKFELTSETPKRCELINEVLCEVLSSKGW